MSEATKARLDALFVQADREEAERLLQERCGRNLPFYESSSAEDLERVRFAALKLSNADLAALRSAVDLANTDWRDLLVAAGLRATWRRIEPGFRVALHPDDEKTVE